MKEVLTKKVFPRKLVKKLHFLLKGEKIENEKTTEKIICERKAQFA